MGEHELPSEEHSSAFLRLRALARNSCGGSTWTRAHIASCPVPQYSWQGISCSPVLRNVVVNVATKPGISITFALVVPTTKPWIASVLVPRNVTGISAGTTMHCGSNEYCCAMSRTITLPSAPSVGAEVALDELAGDVQRCADRSSPRATAASPPSAGR